MMAQSVDALYTIMRNTTAAASYQTGGQEEEQATLTPVGPDIVSKYFNFTSAGIRDWRY
jgi:hypothetical protein